jgi:signal transduction histidine kinase
VVSLGAARNVLARDPRGAEQLLTSAQQQLRETVTTVRSLVECLAPAVEQLGLVQALCEGAHRLTAPAGVELDLEVAALPPPPRGRSATVGHRRRAWPAGRNSPALGMRTGGGSIRTRLRTQSGA